MRQITALLILLTCLVPQACKRVSLQIDGDEPARITLPMFVIFQAMRFTDDDVLEIDDLGGVEEEIPMKAIAQAIRDGGDQIKVSFRQGNTRILGEKRGGVFHIEMDSPEDEERLRMNIPEDLMLALLESQEGHVNQRRVKRALKRYSGVLLEVESPYERVRIVLR